MAGEVIAFAVISNAVVTFNEEVNRLLVHQIPLQMLTASKCLFRVISKVSQTPEK